MLFHPKNKQVLASILTSNKDLNKIVGRVSFSWRVDVHILTTSFCNVSRRNLLYMEMKVSNFSQSVAAKVSRRCLKNTARQIGHAK